MSAFIPYGRQSVDEEDIEAVVDVLRSDWLTQGPAVERFEKALADYCGAKYAVAVSSGTAGLHLACLAAGVGPGDKVITSPITFVASANCALYCGAEPVFVDIDPATINIDVDRLAARLGPESKKSGDVFKAVIPVHFAGLPSDMEAISRTARDHGLTVIEDACHALGSEYQSDDGWVKVGSCRHSAMTVFSFHPVKQITTGEGGAVTTNDAELYDRLIALRTHGITKKPDRLAGRGDAAGGWYYEMQELGLNYRLTDFQSALGGSQLKKLDGFVAARRRLAEVYRNAFAGNRAIRLVSEPASSRSSHHLFVIQVENRLRLYNRLHKAGIGAQVHYIPVYRQPYYSRRFKYRPDDFPAAENYYRGALSLPIFPGLDDAGADRVIDIVARHCDSGD